MKIITAENKGFYASVLDTLRHIRICELNKEGFRIEWGPESLYYDSSKGLNAWEHFFKQPSSGVEYLTNYPPTQWVSGYVDIPEQGEEFKKTMHRLIGKYLKYTDEVADYITSFLQNMPNYVNTGTNVGTLGVHIRYTDKLNWRGYGEPDSARPIDIETYIKYAEKILEKKHLSNIFLASDNIEAVNAFSKRFGKMLICTNCPRSSGVEAIHSGMKHVSGKIKGLSVMVDVEGLAHCDYILRSTSNVGSFAQFMNLDLKHINLNEILLGDTREQQYGLTSDENIF